MRNLLPASLRLSPLQWVVGSVLLAWTTWLFVQPRIARRERIRALENLWFQQEFSLMECAAKLPSETRWLQIVKAEVVVKSLLGPESHQHIDRLRELNEDFELVFLRGRSATPTDGIPNYDRAIVIPPMTFKTPIPKITNDLGVIWIPYAHEFLSQANGTLTDNLLKIASK